MNAEKTNAVNVNALKTICAALLRDDSGQAFLETAFFAPLVVFGICAVIFFAQLGVLAERSESAVRYGNDVSYKNGNQAYSIASVYALVDEIQNPSDNELGPLCLQNNPNAVPTAVPTGGTTNSANETKIQTDIAQAVILNEQVSPSATPAASAKPFYKPVSVSVPGCQAGMIRLSPANSTGGSSGQSAASTANGGLPLSTVGLSVTSSIENSRMMGAFTTGLNLFISPGTEPNLTTTAHMTFLNVAAPSVLAACTPAGAAAASVLGGGLSTAQQANLAALCPTAPTGT